jgi:rubredoxin
MQDEIKLITLRTFDNSINAHITKTRLEAEGVECVLFDELINTLNPLYNVTVGGIKLQIKDSDLDKAELIMKEIESSKLKNDQDEIVVCPKCESTDFYNGFRSMKGTKGFFSAVVSFLLGVFPIYFKTVYRCKECGYEFKNIKEATKKQR